jgi:hypothetical protein
VSGLPDGLFSNQKSHLGSILEGLAIENLGTFYAHLVYFSAIENISRPIGIFCGHLVHFSPFWNIVPEKSGNPGVAVVAHLIASETFTFMFRRRLFKVAKTFSLPCLTMESGRQPSPTFCLDPSLRP